VFRIRIQFGPLIRIRLRNVDPDLGTYKNYCQKLKFTMMAKNIFKLNFFVFDEIFFKYQNSFHFGEISWFRATLSYWSIFSSFFVWSFIIISEILETNIHYFYFREIFAIHLGFRHKKNLRNTKLKSPVKFIDHSTIIWCRYAKSLKKIFIQFSYALFAAVQLISA
jgi:hypothetical protein